MTEKLNKLTISAFAEVTGYSTQQLSNYQKKVSQDKFKFVNEDNQVYVLCTNSELKNYRKNMKANTIEAEAEKTTETLESLQKEINNITENFSKDIKQEFEKIHEMQTRSITSINNRVESINTNNESVTSIVQSFYKMTKEFLDVSQKISTEHSEYKVLLTDLETKHENMKNIISATIAATNNIIAAQSQVEITTKRYNKAIEDNIYKINNTSAAIEKMLESIDDIKTKIENKEKESYFKKYLLPIFIPFFLLAILLIINFHTHEIYIKNQGYIYSKIDDLEQAIKNIPRKK